MKWCIPAFATSLVVFLLLFAAIDLRRNAKETRQGAGIDPPIAVSETPNASEETRLAGRPQVEVHSNPRATRIPPPVEAEQRILPAQVALVFEQRLEEEVLVPLRERRAAWFDRRNFSRAAPRFENYDFTRIEMPKDAAAIADAALVLREGEAARLLLLRVAEGGGGFECSMARSASGWGSAEEFVRGFPRTVESLPVAPDGTKRLRLGGPFYERVKVEQVERPLEERAEELRLTSLLSRMYPSDTSFTLTSIEDATEWPADADGLIELSAEEVIEGGTVRIPLRYGVNEGAMQLHFAGEWRPAKELIAKIRAKRSHVLDENGTVIRPGLRAEWLLRS